jgi:hypothetical protein
MRSFAAVHTADNFRYNNSQFTCQDHFLYDSVLKLKHYNF